MAGDVGEAVVGATVCVVVTLDSGDDVVKDPDGDGETVPTDVVAVVAAGDVVTGSVSAPEHAPTMRAAAQVKVRLRVIFITARVSRRTATLQLWLLS